jgi:hypothetical protein
MSENAKPTPRPRQIMDQRALYPDRFIRLRNTSGFSRIVKITRGPYKDDTYLKLDYKFSQGQKPKFGSIFLEDYAVIAKQSGRWDPDNWIEKV